MTRYRPLPLGGSLTATFTLRADGSTLVASTEPLGAYPARLTDRLLHWVEVAPDRTLVAQRTGDGGWRRVSYAEALRSARAIAQALLDRGVSVERPLAILSDNDIEQLLLGLGAMLAGVPYAPVSAAYSLLSHDHGKLRHILGVLTPGLVYAANGAAFARAIRAAVPTDTPVVLGGTGIGEAGIGRTSVSEPGVSEPGVSDTGVSETQRREADLRQSADEREWIGFADLLATVPTPAVDAAHAAVGPDTIAKFLFTSGSTKLPKGVINTHRMLCANQQMLLQCFPGFAEEPPVLVDWLPWNHTFGGNHNVGITLYNGGSLYIDEGKPTAALVGETLRNLREIAPTLYFNVPKGFEEIANALEVDAELRKVFFSRVNMLFFSGAGLSQPVWDKLDRLAELECGERIRMLTGLGMTETAPFAICANAHEVKSGHIGLPAPGLELKLVPHGDKVEVRYRGPNVTPGYWRAPEQTAEAFDAEGFYCSGDAVRPMDPSRPEMGLSFDGRVADDFKLSTGTFVSVGPLRAKIVAAGDPFVQDVVVAGMNRNEVGILIFPRVEACVALAELPPGTPVEQVLAHPAVRGAFQGLVDGLWASGTGSSTRVARAVVLDAPPSIDRGEITDKGSLNQRAVLTHRQALVDALFDAPDAGVIVARR